MTQQEQINAAVRIIAEIETAAVNDMRTRGIAVTAELVRRRTHDAVLIYAARLKLLDP